MGVLVDIQNKVNKLYNKMKSSTDMFSYITRDGLAFYIERCDGTKVHYNGVTDTLAETV